MHICSLQQCTHITPKNARYALHEHSQCSIFHRKFTKHTNFPSTTPSDVRNTPPNRSMETELLIVPQRNVRPRIDNPSASASKLNIGRSVLTTQVTEGHGLTPSNLENEKKIIGQCRLNFVFKT